MALSRKVPTERKVEGREFVNIDDFLECYSHVDSTHLDRLKGELEQFGGEVEKRVEDPLVSKLVQTCWECKSDKADQAPIVLRDGWVIWVTNGHEPLIDSLGRLFVDRQENKRSLAESLAILSGEVEMPDEPPNIDLLTAGHAWYVSTVAPQIIHTGRIYRQTRNDRALFETFRVQFID